MNHIIRFILPTAMVNMFIIISNTMTNICIIAVNKMNDPDNPVLLERAFKDLDSDGSGSIDRAELKIKIAEIMKGTGEMLTDDDIDDMLNDFDTDRDGEISFKEFAKVMTESGD